jgi:uncharacterized protein YutE (UPF0331/DUF86 family)
MVDRDRVLSKIAELEEYLRELNLIRPGSREKYEAIEKKRACERLLQISIETVISICQLFVVGLRLGLPAEENDVFEKLARAGVISRDLETILRRMKGFRNVLVHEYGKVDDDLTYLFLTTRTADFLLFRQEILAALRDNEQHDH